jgi:SAM-dependent methyltransferase
MIMCIISLEVARRFHERSLSRMTTFTSAIQRHYDQVIAPHYDRDPQAVLDSSLMRAINQLRAHRVLAPAAAAAAAPAAGDAAGAALDVLDVGVGTGRFLEKLKVASGGRPLRLFGLDLSAEMVAIARQRLPGLQVAVDDAVNLADHFDGQSFDLVCTHFITGLVPMAALAPIIRSRTREGGFWSLVGGTKAGFPALQMEADRAVVRRVLGGRRLAVDTMTCNPTGREEVVSTLEAHGFGVVSAETFEPALKFEDVDEFIEFGYHGGWLTPFVEALGLHEAGQVKRTLIDLLVFPIEDQHNIEIVLARKK